VWQRWVRQPQRIWLRRAFFQMHLWSGIAAGLYILIISVTGSVLVYWNELYRAATPAPIISKGSGPRLTDDQLAAAARHSYPGYRVVKISRSRNLDQAADVSLRRGDKTRRRLFDPRSGSDLGDPVPIGFWLVGRVLDLHDNLLAGPTGRKVNGVGAVALLVLAVSGLAIWWPGIKTWRRSLTWQRGFPDLFQNVADRLEPLTRANAGIRIGDKVIYWLAYLHFGRIQGIGIPCRGPGLCDQTTKAIWALFGLAPAAMFVSSAILWWNRVLRPRLASSRPPVRSHVVDAC